MTGRAAHLDYLLDRASELQRQYDLTPWWRLIRRRRLMDEFLVVAAEVQDIEQYRVRHGLA